MLMAHIGAPQTPLQNKSHSGTKPLSLFKRSCPPLWGPCCINVFWQLGRHDHLGRWLLLTTTLPKSHYRIFWFTFLLTIFRRFHEKWRETTLKNSEIFWHRAKSHLLSFACILPKECCRPLPSVGTSQPRIWLTLNPLTCKVAIVLTVDRLTYS